MNGCTGPTTHVVFRAPAHPSVPITSRKRLPSLQHKSARTQPLNNVTICRISRSSEIGDEFIQAGPSDSPPSYQAIDSQPLNRAVYSLFRARMVAALDGMDSPMQGYDAIIDLTRRLNARGSPLDTQATTRRILNSLFPSWLPPAFNIMFSRPFPTFSCQMNAWATWLTCQWLMGPCEVNAVEIDGGGIGAGHGVLVKRCRYLEEAGCASVCINSCKVPTQEFFARDMGLPLTMTPNYETFECQFAFGRSPPPQEGDEAFATACFSQCPTKAAARERICHKISVPS